MLTATTGEDLQTIGSQVLKVTPLTVQEVRSEHRKILEALEYFVVTTSLGELCRKS